MIDVQPLRDFIKKEFLFDSTASLADDQVLFPDVIDSLGVMEVVDFIEERYGVDIAEDDLVIANFSTLSAMADLVQRKNAAPAS